ncbi:cellulose binding domain-containing protein [Micromonospora sp. CPCC 206061]|uniref:cellulose binding domain-containing protein n=1 Tax=Micromonospora sp. CPCC 206061 TaxID=3122410 RepID=UPI002FEE9CE5
MATLVGAATLVAPGAAYADTAALSRRPFGSGSYILVFSITNDTSAPLNGWRMEFDLPPGEFVQGLFTFSIRVTKVDQHFILENANPVTINPGRSVNYGIPILGQSWPQNCLSRGTPCSIDTEPPSTPTNVRIGRLPYTSTGTWLQWSMSTDNVAVAAYEVTRNGAVIATTTGGSYALPAADSGAVYGVRALDDMGNRSGLATAVYPS